MRIEGFFFYPGRIQVIQVLGCRQAGKRHCVLIGVRQVEKESWLHMKQAVI